MLKIREAVIVEGRYDKIKLSSIVDAPIIETNGFRVFSDKEKQLLIRKIAETRGILIMTDSDGAGFVIRNFLKGSVDNSKIKNCYIPQIKGKEKRKAKGGKEGLLGVEGVSVVVCAFECGIEYSTGRGNLQQCGMNIIKGFLAVSLFTVVPVRLYALSVSLQGTFSAGLTGYGRSIGEVGQDIITELKEIQTLTDVVNSSHFGLGIITSPIMLLFCIILMGYAVLKVFFANLKRGGILLIQIAVGSLYMFSVPRGYLDGFMGWMRQVIGLCLTAFLQSTILIAGLMVFKDHALMGVGLMLSAGEVPRIAGSFGLDTTTKANITSAVYTAQSAVNVTRTIAAAIK